MKFRTPALAFVATLPVLLAGCGGNETKEMSFKADVQPILENHCYKCHTNDGPGQKISGLNMGSYESLMKGTKYGSVIKEGDSFTSAMVMLLEGRADPRLKMPHGNEEPLSQAQIDTIKAWIDQGAKNN
ncbi:MAG: hypothetical protein H6980_07265 [Gammaproteobacteria bacterium]|nr:hypothetical protein [Gammaproteobacteria bacterium]